MEAILRELWSILGLPQVWGIIVTVVIIGVAWLLKGLIQHSLDLSLEKMRLDSRDIEFFREHYSGLKDFASVESVALRQSYLEIFEPMNCKLTHEDDEPSARLQIAIENILNPLRENLGVLDESTASKIYSMSNYLRGYVGKEEELGGAKNLLFMISESVRKYIRADRIAFRLGLVSHLLNEPSMVKVKVIAKGVPIVGYYTNPQVGTEIEITEDEWSSEEIQRYVREKKIKKQS